MKIFRDIRLIPVVLIAVAALAVHVREQALDFHSADTRADTPRVVVSFDSCHGPLRYQCDRFTTTRAGTKAWHANVRAIALGLEALRKVDRYGIAGSGEQYRGWTALPAAFAAGAVDMDH